MKSCKYMSAEELPMIPVHTTSGGRAMTMSLWGIGCTSGLMHRA